MIDQRRMTIHDVVRKGRAGLRRRGGPSCRVDRPFGACGTAASLHQPRVNANSVPGGPPRRRRKRLHGDRPRRADPRPPGRCAFQNTGPGAVGTGSDFRLSLRSKICIALWFQALIWSEKGAEVHLIINFPCENIPFFFFFS